MLYAFGLLVCVGAFGVPMHRSYQPGSTLVDFSSTSNQTARFPQKNSHTATGPVFFFFFIERIEELKVSRMKANMVLQLDRCMHLIFEF